MNSDIYSFLNWINKLLSEENKVPRTLFEVKNVAGFAKYNNQYEIKRQYEDCVVL